MATVYTMTDPSILVGAVQLKCLSSKVSLIPTDNFVDVETFCNPGGEAPSTTTWVMSATIVQSFGADGAWNLLNPLAGTTVTIVLKPDDSAIGVGNPTATFSAYVPSIPFVDSEVGEATRYDLEFKLVGGPVYTTA